MTEEVDTELRDLVIEALEKNGSLAQIRASLRANVFLAFEDDSEDIKHNPNLDYLLKLPEGVVALCIVHEFLESLNLTNTLGVYSSETRQGKPYKYVGRKNIIQKLKMNNVLPQEPVLVSILKKFLRPVSHKVDQGGDDQNCTYIVHEDSSTNSSTTSSQTNSNSENSNLEIPLDMSDTDTSSDSREKTCSEYIPNKNVIIVESDEEKSKTIDNFNQVDSDKKFDLSDKKENIIGTKINKINSIENVNTNSYFENKSVQLPSEKHCSSESQSGVSNNESSVKESTDNQFQNYSLDFSESPRFNSQIELNKLGASNQEQLLDSPHLNSHSSISISDVADLLEDSDISQSRNVSKKQVGDNLNNIVDKNNENKYNSDDSGDSVPSISNLSLNFHSE